MEGYAERAFADATLATHLAEFSVNLQTRIVVTNRKLGARGGGTYFATFKRDLALLMQDQSNADVRFSSMIDLYALPQDFPKWREAQRIEPPVTRVQFLQNAWSELVDDSRFLPFIQLHEFEALLCCNLAELEKRIEDSAQEIEALRQEVGTMPPELINDGLTTAPSKRIIRHVPSYAKNKVRVGALAASAIGLVELRKKCPHFDSWIARLEQLGSA